MKHIISLGAGVQSSTMALMAAHGEISPMPDCAIFADTQAEPQSVYTWLDWLEIQLPFPVIRVTAGSLADSVTDMRYTADGRLYSKTNIPFFTRNDDGGQGIIKNRSCTKDYKIRPIEKEARAQVGREEMKLWRREHRDDLKEIARLKKAKENYYLCEGWKNCQADPLVVQWIGISLDEATRMKPSRVPWLVTRWPLIEHRIKRNECLIWMKDNEYPTPPRSSCVFCPYHNNDEWRRLRDDEPEEFQKAVEFEIQVQAAKAKSANFKTKPFLHRSLVALEAVDFTTAEERGQGNLFEEECTGYCGN